MKRAFGNGSIVSASAKLIAFDVSHRKGLQQFHSR